MTQEALKKRHPSLFLQNDSVFDADLEAEFVDFVLVYDPTLKSNRRREFRINYLNNLVKNGLKVNFRVSWIEALNVIALVLRKTKNLYRKGVFK